MAGGSSFATIAPISNGKVVDQVKTISGSPNAQKRELPHPTADYSGSGNPIYESIFSIGNIIKMRAEEKGVGFIKIPLEPLPDFRGVNQRSELLIHDDPNRAYARGSIGCIVTYTVRDLHRIVKWCQQQNRPRILVVDYGKGLLRERGIIINLGRSATSNPASRLMFSRRNFLVAKVF